MKGLLDGWLPAPLAEPEIGDDIALVSEEQSESLDLEYEQCSGPTSGVRQALGLTASPVEEGW